MVVASTHRAACNRGVLSCCVDSSCEQEAVKFFLGTHLVLCTNAREASVVVGSTQGAASNTKDSLHFYVDCSRL